MTDCSDAYATIAPSAGNSAARSVRILLAYVRNNMATFCLSFLVANRNIADLGPKTSGNRGIWRMVAGYSRIGVSFWGELDRAGQAAQGVTVSIPLDINKA